MELSVLLLGIFILGICDGEALSFGKLMLPGDLCGWGIVGDGSTCGMFSTFLGCFPLRSRLSVEGFCGVAGSFLPGRLGAPAAAAPRVPSPALGLGLRERSVRLADP